MSRIAKLTTAGMLCMSVGLMMSSSSARDDVILTAALGNGVHAYFAGDYQRSYEELSAAIEGGTEDPRAHYFRGLAALRLGRFDEADGDFAAGAKAEAAGRGDWPVGRSLERIQGGPRLQLEKYRARARLAAMQQRRDAIVRHYSQVEAVSPDVQRVQRPENLPGISPSTSITPPPAEVPASPPSAPLPEAEEPEPVKKPTAPPADEDKPAPPSPPPAPAPKPKFVDPFGDDPF